MMGDIDEFRDLMHSRIIQHDAGVRQVTKFIDIVHRHALFGRVLLHVMN